MDKILKIKLDWKIILFLAVIVLAVVLRVWHFHDWLFFKMDQARDALLAQKALADGIGWLPLLGPKAGGTHVNVGPAFYYFQYLAAFLFQSAHPAVLAYPDLLFSILSIPLFYLFLKKYFSRDWSMILAGLYAICFLGIEYARFSWNPNALVFFNLLFLYSLLNVFDESVKYKLRWIAMAGFSFAVSTQLHFLSFATLPVITVVFFFESRREIKKYLDWKKAALFIAIILLVYLPVFLNEMVTHGNNTSAFIAALKNKPSNHSFWKNILRDFRYWGQNWFLILTSWIGKKGSLKSSYIAWLGVMLPGLFLAIHFFRKEKNSLKKKFLLISFLWFTAYFLIYIPFAYQIRPRFFLPLLALPFIFLGYVAKYFWEKNRKVIKAGVALVLAVVFLGNLYGTHLWFKEIRSAQKKGVYPQRTIILKARDGIVLWHLEKAAEFIKNDCPGKRVYYFASAEYKHPVKYVLNLSGIDAVSAGAYDPKKEGCFYDFGLTRANKSKKPYQAPEQFDTLSVEKIGALSVYKLEIRPDLKADYPAGKEKDEKSKRIFWKDIVK
jgi:hypothetical protein